MSKPRLAILAPLKEWGGIERKVMILCREFLQLGVQPQLILTRGGCVPYPDEFPKEVEIIDLKSKGKLDGTFKLIHQLKADPPDAILTAKDHAAKVAILARVIGRFKIPIFVKVTNTPSYTLKKRIKRASAKWLYPRADRVIAVSKGVRNDLIRNFSVPAAKIEVIYNPTVTPCIEGRTKLPIVHPWLQGAGPPVIIAAGRLTPQKDFSTLISAFARVRSTTHVRLIVLGEGPLRETLINQARMLGISEDIDLPGYVSDPIPFFARASLFALSSKYEGLANVVIEALAAGLPVVSTDCPSGPTEILLNGRIGPLVSPADPEGLANAMGDTLRNPPSSELIKEGLARFQSDQVARRYLDLMHIRV